MTPAVCTMISGSSWTASLKSWAVPKGPSLDPGKKSLAVHVEDHPLEYGSFEGVIPQGEYGGGTVMLWDRGTWEPEGDAAESYRRGKLVFRLNGERLKGRWALIRMGGKAGQDGKNWLLKKIDDDEARPADDHDILDRDDHERRHRPNHGSNRRQHETRQETEPEGTHAEKIVQPPNGADRRIRKPSALATPSTHRHLEGARQIGDARQDRSRASHPGGEGPAGGGMDATSSSSTATGSSASCATARPRCYTRRGHDWTHRFPTIAAALEKLGVGDVILDGEIVVLRPDGTSDFQALQNVMRHGDDDSIVYFVFDLLYYRGHDLRQVALIERKQLLSRLLDQAKALCRDPLQRSYFRRRRAGLLDRLPSWPGRNRRQANRQPLRGAADGRLGEGQMPEASGIRDRRLDGTRRRRASRWGRCWSVTIAVRRSWSIAGGSAPASPSSRSAIFAELLEPLEQKRSPFREPPAGVAARGVIHWVKPKLVAEVAFAAWTADGLLRHASFQGIREDKAPTEITRELPIDNRFVPSTRPSTKITRNTRSKPWHLPARRSQSTSTIRRMCSPAFG